MSRDDGFRVADQDTAFMSDVKVLALARRIRDPIKTGAAIALHDAVRLASWGCGHRLTLEEALPGWWLDPVDELADHLVNVGLLDEERRITVRAWEGWFMPAHDRRERYRDLGARGGRAAHRDESDPASTTVERTVERTVEPVRSVPSVPTDPSVRPSVRPTQMNGRTTRKSDVEMNTTCPGCGELLNDKDTNVVVTNRGRQLRHRECPSAVSA